MELTVTEVVVTVVLVLEVRVDVIVPVTVTTGICVIVRVDVVVPVVVTVFVRVRVVVPVVKGPVGTVDVLIRGAPDLQRAHPAAPHFVFSESLRPSPLAIRRLL